MIERIFICALCFGITMLTAQSNSFNNWHFGNKAAITFNTNPASYVPGSVINTLESCGAISDTNGVLRFYTDGIRGIIKSTSKCLILKNIATLLLYFIRAKFSCLK